VNFRGDGPPPRSTSIPNKNLLPKHVFHNLDPTDHQRTEHPTGLGRGKRAGSPLGELRALAPQKSGDGWPLLTTRKTPQT